MWGAMWLVTVEEIFMDLKNIFRDGPWLPNVIRALVILVLSQVIGYMWLCPLMAKLLGWHK